jgi:hypothetical protein
MTMTMHAPVAPWQTQDAPDSTRFQWSMDGATSDAPVALAGMPDRAVLESYVHEQLTAAAPAEPWLVAATAGTPLPAAAPAMPLAERHVLLRPPGRADGLLGLFAGLVLLGLPIVGAVALGAWKAAPPAPKPAPQVVTTTTQPVAAAPVTSATTDAAVTDAALAPATGDAATATAPAPATGAATPAAANASATPVRRAGGQGSNATRTPAATGGGATSSTKPAAAKPAAAKPAAAKPAASRPPAASNHASHASGGGAAAQPAAAQPAPAAATPAPAPQPQVVVTNEQPAAASAWS